MKFLSVTSVFVIVLLFFTSCSKESAILSTDDLETVIAERNSTIDVQVSGITFSILSQEVVVEYEAAYDFSNSVLENNQLLKFHDNGTPTSFNLSVNTYTGAQDALQVRYDLGGNNLSGLDLDSGQWIILDDLIE